MIVFRGCHRCDDNVMSTGLQKETDQVIHISRAPYQTGPRKRRSAAEEAERTRIERAREKSRGRFTCLGCRI